MTEVGTKIVIMSDMLVYDYVGTIISRHDKYFSAEVTNYGFHHIYSFHVDNYYNTSTKYELLRNYNMKKLLEIIT